MKLVIFSLLLSVCGTGFAQIHKCKGPNGTTIYSDAACAAPEDMQRVKINQNTVDASGDRRNAQEMRARAQIEDLQNNPPAQCKFAAFKFRDEKGKRLAADAQQECLQNVIAERNGQATSDRKYRLWNDHHTLATNKRNAAIAAAASANRRPGNMTCQPNAMGTALDCRPGY